MSASPPRALVVGPLNDVPALGGYHVARAESAAEALAALGGESTYDAVLLDGDAVACSAAEAEALAGHAALVVVCADADAEHATGWLRRGADDVLGRDELLAAVGARRLRFALERHAHTSRRVPAYATDLSTGLPHRRQLIEHLSQLIALREREPAPMALVAVRVGGLGSADAALRRKIGVRLRAGVRASDLVAAADADSFIVLLGSLLAPADADRVAAKLVTALVAPFRIGGRERTIAVASGLARFPDEGKVADRLVRRALALAEAAPWQGSASPGGEGAAGPLEPAANDER